MFDHKKYYIENKEKWQHKSSEEREEKLKYKKEYREKKKKEIAEYKKEWRQKNKDKCAEQKERQLLKLNLVNAKVSSRTLTAWAKQVKKETKSCCYCGSRERLQAHHILSKSKHSEFALFLNNGIALCEVCHIQEHKLNGEM